jgi:hypothetical protein
MGGNGDCGCNGGGCSCNGNGTNGGMKPAAGYNGVNQRRMLMPGPFLVRKPAALSTTAITGDGKGSENPVPVAGANQVVLLVDANKSATPSTRPLTAWMEITINGTDYYRETDVGTGATAQVTKKTYSVDTVNQFANNTDERIAIAINVLAAFARFTFQLGSGSADFTNVACRAITGRV